MGWWDDFKGWMNEPSRGANSPYRDPNRENFNVPGYDDIQNRYGDYLSQVDNRQTPQLGAASDFRGDQRGLADLLMDRAQGRNSVAELQLRQGADMANRQAASLAAGARPSNSAMATRLAMESSGNTMMGLSGQTALARAQEANMAAGSLGQVLGQARGADEARTLAELEAAQRQQAMDDAARNALLGQSLGAAGLQQQGGIGYEGARTDRYTSELGVPTRKDQIIGGIKDILKVTTMGSGGG